METTQKKLGLKTIAQILLPLIFLGVFFITFLKYGPLGVFETAVAPIEDVFIQRVVFDRELITVEMYNNGPTPVTIAQTMINDAYWKFEMEPADNTLESRQQGSLKIYYPWLEGDPQHIALLSSNGVLFTETVEAAAFTPKPDGNFVQAFILLGLYVGVIPVMLGLMWLPFLRRLRGKWYDFLISLTVGLLLFLGIDAVAEALELTAEVPSSLNGIGIFFIGLFLAILALAAVSYKTQHLKAEKTGHEKAIMLGYLIALGIGLHNLGEGLAVGSAYAIGEVALGSSLVIGFMLHNVTEGIAIIAPIARTTKKISQDIHRIVLMGILAGVPTIIGSLIGGFAYTTEFALFFLAIGAGAIFDVTYDILKGMARDNWMSIFSVTNVAGFLVGLMIMYMTGFLVM
jgi:zinc transporter, ZIP family